MDPTTVKLFAGASGYTLNPTVSITGYANPSGTNHGGDGYINWITNDVSAISINEGIGTVASSGSLYVNRSGQTVTYTITATISGGGLISSSVTIAFGTYVTCTARQIMSGDC